MKSVIEPVYQPVADTRTHQIEYLEALARVRGDTTGAGHVPLIRLSEQIGFIQQIDLAMLEQVMAVLPETQMPVAVNLSVLTIERASAQLCDLLDRQPSMLPRLLIEITETVQITQLHEVQVFIGFARHFGARICVDDYGDGHFTLPVVHELCPDFIKLAPALLSRLYDFDDATALAPVLEVATDCNAQLVAEHVDSIRKVTALLRYPIRFAQGFSFGLPGPHPERRTVESLRG